MPEKPCTTAGMPWANFWAPWAMNTTPRTMRSAVRPMEVDVVRMATKVAGDASPIVLEQGTDRASPEHAQSMPRQRSAEGRTAPQESAPRPVCCWRRSMCSDACALVRSAGSLLAGFTGQGVEVAALRSGHRLVAGDPLLGVLARVGGGVGSGAAEGLALDRCVRGLLLVAVCVTHVRDGTPHPRHDTQQRRPPKRLRPQSPRTAPGRARRHSWRSARRGRRGGSRSSPHARRSGRPRAVRRRAAPTP